MNIEKMLNVEVQEEFAEISKLEVGTEQYKTSVDGITKLLDKSIELETLEMEKKSKEKEYEFRLKEMERDRKDQMIKNSIAIAGIVVPAALTVWGTLKSLKFELEGTVTTIIGRGFLNKLLPKK